jgi:uncharacterized RDD family membrane protein YckC
MNADAVFAGFWQRTVAFIIDKFILFIPLLALILSMKIHLEDNKDFFYAFGLIEAVYYIGFLSSRWQATPGKRLMKTYIVYASNYEGLGVGRAFLRLMAFDLLLLLLILMFGFANKTFIHADLPIFSNTQEGLSQIDIERFKEIREREFSGKPVTTEEDKFFMETRETIDQAKHRSKRIMDLITVISLMIMSLPIAFTRQKTGFHDMICKTRALKGRPTV